MFGEELRALMGRVPSSVAVLTVDPNGQPLGLTVGSLVALALEPPLVAIVVSRQAAMHELLRESGGFAVSILAASQESLAQHFARGVPPIAMWDGIAVAGAMRSRRTPIASPPWESSATRSMVSTSWRPGPPVPEHGSWRSARSTGMTRSFSNGHRCAT